MNKIIIIMLALVSISGVNALVSNITEFDDGGSSENTTANVSKYISIPVASTITQANITIEGFNLTVGTGLFLSQNIVPDAYHNDSKFNSSYPADNAFDGNTSTYTITIYEPDEDGDPKVDSCVAHIGTLWENHTIPNDADGVNLTLKGALTGSGGDGTLIQFYNGSTWRNDTDQDCWLESWDETYRHTCLIDFSNHPNISGTLQTRFKVQTYTCGITTGALRITQVNETEYDWIYAGYPQDVLITVNNTVTFNHTGNLTGTNRSIDFSSELSTCNAVNDNCDLTFSAGKWGRMIITDLFVEYSKNNTALLTFSSPGQVTESGSGQKDINLVLENTGDWDAKNCSFRTVSAIATPNYNNSITYDSFSVNLSSTTAVILTITDINQDSEPDERIQFYCTNATQEEGTVYSEFIDFDITYVEPTSSGGGGTKIVDLTNKTVIIDWGVIIKEYTILYVPTIIDDQFIIQNIGNLAFNGDLEVSDDLKQYLDVSVCDETLLNCITENIKINPGESRAVNVQAELTEFEEYEEGFFKLASDDEDEGIFELKVSIGRIPGYRIQRAFVQQGFSERLSLLFSFLLIAGIGGLIFYEINTTGGLL